MLSSYREKPNEIPQTTWDGLNEAGRFYLADFSSNARIAEDKK